MKKSLSPSLVLAAAGTMLALGNVAHAQQLINVSGSSLLGSFVRGQASTNDYVGISAQNPGPGTDLIGGGVLSVNYRVSGSINGFDELLNYGYPSFVTSADDRTPGNTTPLNSLLLTDEWYNRSQYITSGATSGVYNLLNPGGQPQRAVTSGANRAISGNAGGVTIDVAYIDVPAVWGLRVGSEIAGSPDRKPNTPGYGTNPRPSVGLDGSATGSASGGGFTNALSTLGTRNLADFPGRDTTQQPYDANTVFAYPLTLAPIVALANPGTGITRLKSSELRFLFATGRSVNGENFVVCTRDIGSGTRNGFCNGIALDPSWGIGDNIGVQSTIAQQDQLGPTFWPTNKGATSGMLRTVRYHRLAVGYAGAETAVSGSNPNSWVTSGAANIIDTFNDVFYTPSELATQFPSGPSASDYLRPTLTNIINNTRTGWAINGQAHICTIGDAKAEPNTFRSAALPNSGGDGNSNPAMVNKSAARYVNNILRSITDFQATTPASQLVATPAEFLATNFTLVGAVDNTIDPATLDPISRVANPNFNPFAKSFAQTPGNSVFQSAALATPNTGQFNGLSPRRLDRRVTVNPPGDGVAYSDGRGLADQSYITQGPSGTDGNTVAYESAVDSTGRSVMERNKIAFDFNGDGIRSLADASDMILAYRQRNAGAAWIAPSGVAGAGQDAVIEILGDADGDGSFTMKDVRYWADGLALNAQGKLDRRQGFIAVDNASLTAGGPLNFFGTVLATGTTYTAGASRADIAGPSGRVAPGWAPVGADRRVDGKDIDYVYAQMRGVGIPNPWNSTASANWNDVTQAVRFDLSADINGDLKVDKHDVEEILSILGTTMGDVNLDGVVNQADRDIITAHLGQVNVGWAGGDLNGDGVVNASDLNLAGGTACAADFNTDGSVAVSDIFDFLTAWFSGDARANFNGVNGITVQDIFDFLSAWFTGCH